jgi:hypothetical protein
MDKNKLEVMASHAFTNLTEARTALFTAAEGAITAKADLDTAKYGALIGGVIDGKNAEIREAQLKSHLEAYYAKLELAEKAERGARYGFDKASIEVDTVKTLLRIAELQ